MLASSPGRLLARAAKRSASPAALPRPRAQMPPAVAAIAGAGAAAGAASSPPSSAAAAAADALLAAPRRQIAGTPLASDPARADDVAAALVAVRLASGLCRGVQRALRDEDRRDKDDDSPVTAADYAAQAAVVWALGRARLAGDQGRALSMVAEEDSEALRTPEGRPLLERVTALVNEAIAPHQQQQQQQQGAGPSSDGPLSAEDVIALIDLGASAGGATGRHWVLDPIDGTRGFVGGRQYAVCLALLDGGQLSVGVLGCPNLPHGRRAGDGDGGPEAMHAPDAGALFACARGSGSWSASLWDEACPLERVFVDDDGPVSGARAMESYESRHSDHSFAARVRLAAGITAPSLRLDSQAKYGLLSRGDASVFMRFPPAAYREKIWDHAAGALMVEEAGGKVSDAAGKALDFSLGRWLDGMVGGIVAAPPRVHASVIRAIGEAGEAGGGGYGFTDGGAGPQ